MYKITNIINTVVCYIWKLFRKQVLRVFITRKSFFSIFLTLYLYEMMDDNFIMYVSRIIMLCTLNLYSALCQLEINKPGR